MIDHKHKNQDIWIIIPCYNEEATIARVVTQIFAIIPNIVVVDDASLDNSLAMLKGMPVEIIHNNVNLGYLKSVGKGLRYAFSHNATYAITFDADGQHQAKDLDKFLDIINTNAPDLILGKRSFKNRLTEVIFSLYTKSAYNISDPFCGFKAYKKYFFQKMGSKLESHYTIGLENIIKTLTRYPTVFEEVALSTSKRQDESRFAGRVYGNYLELKAALNLLWYSRASR